jgi:glycosyltransferase involved in cell wall biosynthesis
MTARVCVVIPAYNAAHTLGDALTALQTQAGAPSTELIVVDNASSDDTAAVAQRFGALVLSETRRGPSAARNRGLFATDAEIVAHCDADTVPSRRWLASIVAPFKDPACVLVAGNTQCYPGGTPVERYVAQSGLYDTPRAIGRESFPFAPSLNMAVRRDAAVLVGGWAEEMMTGEDVDFSHRIVQRFGTSIVYAEGAMLYHRTRSDRAALVHQARTYGAGAAHLYRRYPDQLAWDLQKTRSLIDQMIRRSVARVSTRLARVLGSGESDSVEYADYHWLWTSNFWWGFFTA